MDLKGDAMINYPTTRREDRIRRAFIGGCICASIMLSACLMASSGCALLKDPFGIVKKTDDEIAAQKKAENTAEWLGNALAVVGTLTIGAPFAWKSRRKRKDNEGAVGRLVRAIEEADSKTAKKNVRTEALINGGGKTGDRIEALIVNAIRKLR